MNRLTASYTHTAIGGSATSWDNTSIGAPYAEFFGYDANGNITVMNRYGANITGMPLNMDQLIYNYNRDGNFKLVNNRLNYIMDFMPNNAYTVDIDNQSANNYKYDKIGNLIGDVASGMNGTTNRINWNVYGKITSITKNSGMGIDYFYDAGGNRIQKLVNSKEDFYVRDAQGNIMGTYVYDNDTFTWAEQHLYGSSRVGMVTPGLSIQSSAPLANASYNATGDPITNGTEGKRIYELSNHLGNVMVTISDRKIGVDDNSDTVIDYYTAEVLTSQDYYAFGMLMPGRQYSNAGAKYKYGFNGKENDNEVKGEGNQQDYGMRIYDPRLGRFLSVDPLTREYSELTPYQFAGNTPMWAIDIDGLEPYYYTDPKQMFYQGVGDLTQGLSRAWDKFTGFFMSFKLEAEEDYSKTRSKVTTSETTLDIGGKMESWIREGRYSPYNKMPKLKASNIIDVSLKTDRKTELKMKAQAGNVKVEEKVNVEDGSIEEKVTIRVPASKVTRVPLKITSTTGYNNTKETLKSKVDVKTDTGPISAGVIVELEKDKAGKVDGKIGTTATFEIKENNKTITTTVTVGKKF